MKKNCIILLIICFLTSFNQSNAQFSDFAFNESNALTNNPAFSGISDAYSLSFSYLKPKSERPSYLVTFQSFFPKLNSGLSVHFNNNEPIKGLRNIEFGATYSYRCRLTRFWYLASAAQIAYSQNKYSWNDMLPVLNGGSYEPPKKTKNNMDLSAGCLLYSDMIYYGFSVHHINRYQLIDENNEKIPLKYSFIVGYKQLLGKHRRRYRRRSSHSLNFHALYEYQNKYLFVDSINHNVFGNYKRLDFSTKYRHRPFLIGVTYRTYFNNGNSLLLSAGIQIAALAINYEYALALSGEANHSFHQLGIHYAIGRRGRHISSLKKARAVANPLNNSPSSVSGIVPSFRRSGISSQPKQQSGIVLDSVPLDFNTEEYDRIYENPFQNPMEHPYSTFAIDVDNASYANVRRFINSSQMPHPDAVRIEECINYFNYDYPQPKKNEPFSITSEISECPWNTQHKLVHIGLKAKEIVHEQLPPSNLVFLIDVSGSMGQKNKLPLLKKSFNILINNLQPEDRISIVVYASDTGVKLNGATGDEKEKIKDEIEKLGASGYTSGGKGIKDAYRLAQKHFIENGNNRVILATDGDFNVGVSSDANLVRLIEKKREEGVFLSVLGFGMGNYKDAKMEKLSNAGNGNYAYIDNILEAKKVLSTDIHKTLFTVAKDVKIQIEFNPQHVEQYRLIGYENRLLEDRDFNDDKKDAGEMGSGQSVTALYEIIPKGAPVDSSLVPTKTDAPKYQSVVLNDAAQSKELLTLKVRYKNPKDTISQLITHIIKDKNKKPKRTSENFRFSTAVAGFGLLLRNSEYKGSVTYEKVLELARSAKGTDQYGYRSEFIKLVEMCSLLKDEE